MCQGSSFQRVLSFFETETSQLIRKLLEEYWISWGWCSRGNCPRPCVRQFLGGPVTGKAEDQGCTVRPIAAEAILQKIVAQHHPENKEACLECVTQANVKNAMIQVHGHTPHQYVFGQNPRVPSDLYEPPYA